VRAGKSGELARKSGFFLRLFYGVSPDNGTFFSKGIMGVKQSTWVAVRALLLWLGVWVGTDAHAGLRVGHTRVIYTEGTHRQALMLVNTNDYPVVVQTWVDGGQGDPGTVTPFLSLPPVFSLAPKAHQAVRVVLDDAQSLPQDRESVFWLNLHEIPPILPAAPAPARDSLTLALNTQLKIFYRPAQLASVDVAAQLRFTLGKDGASWFVECDNPTPYHASFTTLRVGAGDATAAVAGAMDMMTAPFSRRRYALADPPPAGHTVYFTLVNDKGFAENFQKDF